MSLISIAIFSILILPVSISSTGNCGDVEVSEGQVTKYLDEQLHGVYEFQRPIKNASQPIIVGIAMHIQRLIEVDEQLEMITIAGYFAMVTITSKENPVGIYLIVFLLLFYITVLER